MWTKWMFSVPPLDSDSEDLSSSSSDDELSDENEDDDGDTNDTTDSEEDEFDDYGEISFSEGEDEWFWHILCVDG